jgi:hypothetical protein
MFTPPVPPPKRIGAGIPPAAARNDYQETMIGAPVPGLRRIGVVSLSPIAFEIMNGAQSYFSNIFIGKINYQKQLRSRYYLKKRLIMRLIRNSVLTCIDFPVCRPWVVNQ